MTNKTNAGNKIMAIVQARSDSKRLPGKVLMDFGGMTVIEPSAADKAKLKDVVENFVLKRWAKRCGTQKCVDEWNATIGKVSGMKASL